MDRYSNINTNISCRKIIWNKSVMHSKSPACRSGCRVRVKVSSEILWEKERSTNITTKQLIKLSHLCLYETVNFRPVTFFLLFLPIQGRNLAKKKMRCKFFLAKVWVTADLTACCYPKEWSCSSIPPFRMLLCPHTRHLFQLHSLHQLSCFSGIFLR